MEKAGGKGEELLGAEGDLYFDSLSVDSEKSAEETLGCQVSVGLAGVLLRTCKETPPSPSRRPASRA